MAVRKWVSSLGLLVAGLVGVLVNSIVVYQNLQSLTQATSWVHHTLASERLMADLLKTLLRAESGQRGYLITSSQRYLAEFYEAGGSIPQKLDALQREVDDNPLQIARVVELRQAVTERLNEMSATILAGVVFSGEASTSVDQGRSIINMDVSRSILRDMSAEEARLLAERQAIYDSQWRSSVLSMLAFALTCSMLVLALFFLMRRENRHRIKSPTLHASQVVEIEKTVRALQIERNYVGRIGEINSFLQSCKSLQEIGSLASTFLERLFPNYSGALYLYAASRNQLVRHAQWGGSDSPEVVLPEHCWGLRRGQVHRFSAGAPVCAHHHGEAPEHDSLCLPLIAYGETIGLLSFVAQKGAAEDEEAFDASMSQFSEMAARQLSLAVANLQLRDSLKEQAIRDPLTGAFNRRYLEIVGEKEIAQSLRLNQPLAVVMLDVDHFKKFNDVHGHAAGDFVLVTVCDYIRRHIRESDWMFRYGGEEFVLLIGEAGLHEIEARVDALRAGVAELTIANANAVLPSVTVSIGVAVIESNRMNLQAALRHADRALYASKAAGRNRVTFAESVAEEVSA
ncbi:diguanylate cyclase [Roseomonas frigidaquae]|uniref:diguanylate cyclase n=1 Tax=Falsiroseomonas frigidaquae TaxID=487318 RepID=A0ABX1F7V2_9PROT|nr:diguanylate cyclase [Falsiroseomonas frigidaquae]NKE48319.1 diguanylate cyclase [Falsiroseomonas frigidaquae]